MKAAAALDQAVEGGDPVYLASISLVEVIYLVEKGKLPETAQERIEKALSVPERGFKIFPLDLEVVRKIREIPRDAVPDMPDRVIAATALHLNLPLVTRNMKIQAAIQTIW